MKKHKIKTKHGIYTVEEGHLATIAFAISRECLDNSNCNVLGAAHRHYRLPEDCVVLEVEQQEDAGILHTKVIGARRGHFQFTPTA